VLAGSKDPILIEDLGGTLIELDEIAEQAYGWTRAELLGEPITKVVPPEWHESRDELAARCRREQAVLEGEGVHWTREGKRIPVLLLMLPVTDPRERLLGVATVAQPVAKLRQRLAMIHEIETVLPVIIWMRDLETRRIVYASQTYETLWGRNLDALLAEPGDWLDGVSPEYRARIGAAFEGLLAGNPYDEEYSIILPDGTRRWIRERALPIADESGLITRGVGIAVDVTEEKQVRFSLRRALQAMADVEDEERERLAADLHDSIGQLLPLARIKLDEISEERDETRLAEMIRDLGRLLATTEEEARTLTFQLRPVPLHGVGLISAVEQMCQTVGDRFGLNISVSDDGLEKLLDQGAAAACLRAVRELLINVARHAQTEEVNLRVTLEADMVVVVVEDEGVGFDAADAENVGFGLLSIRNRLEGVGGSLQIESAPGHGTRSRVNLPVSSTEAV
jgi:PAS domain S-box-containing protein